VRDPAASAVRLLDRYLGCHGPGGQVRRHQPHRAGRRGLRADRVTPILGGRFVHLHWANAGGREGRELFEGLAIYEERPDGSLAATWWDSRGGRHAVTATASGSAMSALWGDRGRTVYRLMETGELEVVDSTRQPDGTWAEFGRTMLKRK
jgi:hypothetical protein